MSISGIGTAYQPAGFHPGQAPDRSDMKIQALERDLQRLNTEKQKAAQQKDQEQVKKLEKRIREIEKQIQELRNAQERNADTTATDAKGQNPPPSPDGQSIDELV